MAILRSNDIREMEIEELQSKLLELKAEYSKNRSENAASGVFDNPGKVRELRRTIARVITIMNEKQKEN